MENKKKFVVFIDGSNLFHCQLKNGWKIDFSKFKNYLELQGELVGLYYFTPSPEYTNQEKITAYRGFRDALIHFGYTVIDKELKIIRRTNRETGEVEIERKGNLDGEMVLFMLTTYDKYDEMVFVGGDSDFEMVLDYIVKNKKLVTCISNSRTTAKEIKNIVHRFVSLEELRPAIEDIRENTKKAPD